MVARNSVVIPLKSVRDDAHSHDNSALSSFEWSGWCSTLQLDSHHLLLQECCCYDFQIPLEQQQMDDVARFDLLLVLSNMDSVWDLNYHRSSARNCLLLVQTDQYRWQSSYQTNSLWSHRFGCFVLIYCLMSFSFGITLIHSLPRWISVILQHRMLAVW